MARKRKVNAAAFARQLEEAVVGEDSLVEVEVNAERSVWIKVPINLDTDDDYLHRLAKATSDEEICLEILAHKLGVSAEEQWHIWLDAWGGDERANKKAAKLLMNIMAAEKNDAEERAKNFRYRG